MDGKFGVRKLWRMLMARYNSNNSIVKGRHPKSLALCLIAQ